MQSHVSSETFYWSLLSREHGTCVQDKTWNNFDFKIMQLRSHAGRRDFVDTNEINNTFISVTIVYK